MENKESKNILFSITTFGDFGNGYTGKGGHYYSFSTIIQAIGRYHNVYVLEIGLTISPIVNSLDAEIFFIDVRENRSGSIFRQIKKIINDKEISILHAFDKYSCVYLNNASLKLNIPLVFTLCGGKNPTGLFPLVDNLILFSKENYLFFQKRNTFRKSKLYLIPNRVSKLNIDNKRVEELRKVVDKQQDDIVIMRIARIGEHHIESIKQTQLLANRFRERNDKQRIILVIIGIIQSKAIYEDLKETIGENDYLITSSRYTLNANELLDLSDIVVASGRGAMEAASIKKTVFIPNKKAGVPIRMNTSLFESLFEYNFSDRFECGSSKSNDIINDLDFLIDNYTNLRENIENEGELIYEKYFNVDKGVVTYNKIYASLNKPNRNFKKKMNNILLLLSESIKQLLVQVVF